MLKDQTNMFKTKKIDMILAAVLLVGCTGGETATAEETLLKDFALVVNGLSYHAGLDREKGEATIGVIQYGGYVSGTDIALADGATISPDPETLLGSWPESAEFTISKGDVSEKWTVRLTAYISELPQIDGKDVIFRDEFDTDGDVNPEFWSLIGPGTAAWQVDMSGKKEHSYVKDGNLILVIKRDEDGKVRSGGVKTEYKVGIIHDCHIEARIKFVDDTDNAGQAFWLMPDSRHQVYKGWPDGGEIDIMEHSYLHDYVQQTVHSHYIDVVDPNNRYSGKAAYHAYNPGQYNIYGLDILENSIVFYTNGEKTMTYENMRLENESDMKQWPFVSDYYIILSASPMGAKNLTAPSYMYVDWVRVTKL